jgi:3-hydroxymyristoyl/3-hydroxydecanoyl-(acyl carrier protein) dehydratase
MFVSRVTDIQGEFGQLKPSQLEMEYDIPVDAWYLNEGRVPFPIMTESSHCGILLLSYLGVDEIFKGQLRFRALNSNTKILSEKMLRAGETCRGVFRITSFATVKDITLAFYTYDLFDSEGVQFFTMKGVGGFFREKDLQSAKGYPDTAVAKDITVMKADFKPFLTCEKHAFTAADIANLQQGRNDLCFGRGYVAYNEREQIYSDNFRILHRVSHVDAHGGPYGLGLIKGEADIDPVHWIFGAHFKNDPVLPGIFTIEGGIQLLSFYIHYIGLKDIAGPGSYRNTLLGTESKALFRGEVRREATTLTYECVIKKITSTPEITIASDIKVFNGERIIAVITDMRMKLIRKEECDEASLVA